MSKEAQNPLEGVDQTLDNLGEGIDLNSATRSLAGLLSDDLDEFDEDRGEQDSEEARSGDQDAGDSEDDEEAEESEDDDEAEDEESEEESEEDEEEADEGEEEAETIYTVKVDGEDVQVTLEELTKGYSRTSDYTRKTQAVAEQRKTLETELVELREQREQYGQRLELLEEALKSQQPQEPDWEKLQATDPQQFSVEFARWQRQQQKLQAVQQERLRVSEQQQQDAVLRYQEMIQTEQAKLREAVPEWQDAETEKTALKQIRGYLETEYHASEADIASITDHRFLLMARKAMLWDELQAKGKTKVKGAKVTKKGMTLKPGQPKVKKASKAKAQARAKKRLARTGRVDDAVSLIEDMIEDF